MRQITLDIYKFSELSDKAKKRALEDERPFHPLDEWWDVQYEDAANIGLKITGFDIDRRNDCKGEFTLSAEEVAANILRDHGDVCDTYKAAESYLEKQQVALAEYLEEEAKEDGDRDTLYEKVDVLIAIADKFLKELCDCYWKALCTDYDLYTSDEAIIEHIEANEYEFTKSGKRFLLS